MTNKTLVMISGVIFLLIGVLGFFEQPILGLFAVNSAHNWIHILSGLAAIGFAMGGEDGAKRFAQIFTVVYGLVTILGFIMPDRNLLGLVAINMPDNFLHLALTALFAYIGFMQPSAEGYKERSHHAQA